MLVHLSSNHVVITIDGQTIIVPRGGLEIEFPRILHTLMEKHTIKDIYVINGPGSFTNLRIGCLCLNMLDMIQSRLSDNQKKITLHTIDKIHLFTTLYRRGYIGSHGLLYIGQQKHGWSIHLDTGLVSKTSLLDIDSYHRIDLIDGIDDHRLVSFNLDNHSLVINQGSISHSMSIHEVGFQYVDQLTPHYMIEPNIGK
ncbi:MAG TPA: hypothetical protein PLW93_02740 [Candidatus Absconditabacterales bacterium]|nr:hypothetical protein [Candidatus Absconditabacterales bacterium]HNG97167.1 hypothetical protein [Candidatus Absconditabacterales bacterium]